MGGISVATQQAEKREAEAQGCKGSHTISFGFLSNSIHSYIPVLAPLALQE
jgi:hypothetical protein